MNVPVLRLLAPLALAALAPACSYPAGDRLETFDVVCRTIEEGFYDPSFGGVDWPGLVDRYRPRVASVEGDRAFYTLVNEMLFELGVSHLGLIPDEHPEWIGAPAVFADGEVGIDARVLEGRAVAVRVRPGSPAARAGVRPGALLRLVEGRDLEALRAEALTPPRSPLAEELLVTQALQQGLYGPAGTDTTLVFANVGDEEREVTLRRRARPGRSVIVEGVPPSYLEFEARRIGEDVGYLRFNAFDPALTERILAAVDSFADTAGLVIDLRGNPGGAFEVRRALAERLVTEPCTIWTQRGRRGPVEVDLRPGTDAYGGAVAVLVDVLSCSSAEELSGGLQALGRAAVVGERTTGVVLVADVVRLDIGATLVYPVAETVLADGSTLEGRGVVPDVEVALDRASLAAGRDVQLEAALRHLREAGDR